VNVSFSSRRDRADTTDGTVPVSHVPTARSSGLAKVFVSTFITIFLAEIGDKTQLTTLLMTAESHAPASVFIGAALALIATSAIGVWVGRAIAQRVSPQTIDIAAGAIFLVVSILLFGDAIQL